MKILPVVRFVSIVPIVSDGLKFFWITLYLCFLCCVTLSAQEVNYGLRFKSYETEREKRTSLILSPEKHFHLPGVYTLSFDVKFHSDFVYPFGYILRIINEDKKHMDFLLSQVPRTDQSRVVLTCSSEEIFRKTFTEADLSFDNWIAVTLAIDAKEDLLTIGLNGTLYPVELSGLKSFARPYIGFGKIVYSGFELSDVPSMSVRNIKIQDKKAKTLYNWPLMKYTFDGSLDEVSNQPARVIYPEWVLDGHAIWEKQTQFKTALLPEITYDTDKDEMIVYDPSSFYRYNLQTSQLTQRQLEPETFNRIQANNMIYDPLSGNYLQYIFDLDREKEILPFDTINYKWHYSTESLSSTDYWHHNRYISVKDSCLYLFGGYGHYKYKNEVRIYDFKTNNWLRKKLTGVVPRPHYLSGLGKLDDEHVILFGGYGSDTGNQELFPGYSYTLYKINTSTLESEKIWSLPEPEQNFVVANSLVVDTAKRVFYALAFPSQEFNSRISLLQFSLDHPEYSCLNDSLPVQFEDNCSFVDFYQTSDRERLVAITSGPRFISDTTNIVSIYTLNYPPIPVQDLYQEKSSGRFLSVFLSILWILLGVGVLLLVYKILNSRKQHTEKQILPDEVPVRHYQATPKPRVKLPVTLLGGFCVTDREGKDITKDFTPMLKQLFVLLILYTAKNPKGISSVKLKEILWYDKSDESAKNNRGVSMNKLRQIVSQVGDIRIINANSYWKVEFGENVSCDYIEASYLMELLTGNNNPDPAHILRLVELVSAGELLPNIQIDWIDSFKAEFSDKLIDLLLTFSTCPYVKNNSKSGLEIADAIFIHDSLNEDALRLKCVLLVKSGKNGMARKVYDSFYKEYNQLFGCKYPHSFEQIIG